MSTAASLTKPRSTPLAVRIESDAVALGVVGIVLLVLTVLAWGTWGDLGRDTGYDFVAATRVAHGSIPYVDFVYYYGPLAPFALGLAAFVGGSSVTTFVVVGLLLTYAIVAATYALARTQTGPLGAAIVSVTTAAIAFSPTNLSYVLPHTYSETFAILLALLFLLGLSRASDGAGWGALGAGVAAGLVALTRPEFELAVVFAGALWLTARHRAHRATRRELLSLTLPALLVPVVGYGAFLGAVSPHRLFLENLYPVATLRAGGSAIIKEQAPLTPHSIVLVVAYLLGYAIGVAALVLGARLLERRSNRVAVGAVLAAVLGIVAVAAVDPEAARSKLQWVYGGVPAAAALGVITMAALFIVKRRRLDARDETLLATLAVLTVLALKTYSGFYFLADHAQPAVYAAPFALVAMTRLHLRELGRSSTSRLVGVAWLAALAAICLGLTVKDVRAQSAVVTGPGGSLRVTPAEAPVYRAAIGAIVASTHHGDPILIAPQLSALYTLSGRTDPLPQISLVPGALPTQRDQLDAIRTLERRHVTLVITDRHRFTEYGQTVFGGSFDRRLAGWIHRNFKHAATLRPGGGVDHTLDVWVRGET
jgi:hypothetical protein